MRPRRIMRALRARVVRYASYGRHPRTSLRKFIARQAYAPALRLLFFRPSRYRAAYADLAALSLGQARRHYFAYGRREGRVQSITPPKFLENDKKSQGNKPFVFLVAHEASRTGAPILALALLPRLSRSYRVIVVLRRGGELQENFRRAAAGVIVFSDHGHTPVDLSGPLEKFVEKYKPKFCIANSAEVSGFVTALETMNVPCVFLVHEFFENTANKRGLDEAFSLSSQVVFPATVVAESNRRGSSHLANRSSVIRHQGLPPIPPSTSGGTGSRPPVAGNPEPSQANHLVIGLGSVIPRKGVDLFVQTAHYVVNVLRMSSVKFKWVGHTYDFDYRDQLLDQIRNLGLEDNVAFVDALENLDSTYDEASLLLVSSRHDPFPNVAIQSLVSSTPVVTFDGSTGVAEWLSARKYSEGLVVPYMDTFAAARVISDLLGDPSRLKTIGTKLGRRAAKEFGLDDYVDTLIALGRQAAKVSEGRADAVRTILTSNLFDFELFTGRKISKLQAEKVIARYVQLEHIYPLTPGAPYFLRRAVPGLNTYQYSELNPASADVPGYCALATFIDEGEPSGPWYERPIVIDETAPRSKNLSRHALIHLHLHYPDLLEDFLKRLNRSDFSFELFVTTSSRGAVASIRSAMKAFGVEGKIKVTPNIGRDLVPFLDYALPEAISKGYDFVAHIHTKKSLWYEGDLGDKWREFLWTTLVGSGEISSANQIVNAMVQDEHIGLVFATDALYCGWDTNKVIAQNLLGRLGVKEQLSEHFDFPVGTMFWARPNALSKLSDFKVEIPSEPLPSDGTELHALERLLPTIVSSQGFKTRTVRFPGVQR